ncbi:MAG: S8 family serine peptidase, partial [Pseudonocardiaceae bacterium]
MSSVWGGAASALSRISYASSGRSSPRARHPFLADRAWAFGDGTGSGVRVCVIDSGVDLGVARLPANTTAFAVATSDDVELAVVPDDGGDTVGHGTACASIVADMAPGIELTSVRILGAGLRGQGTALIAALEWAIDNHFHLVNLSLSTRQPDYREAIRDLVDRAYFNGVAIVAAANNRPVSSFPWQFPAVISVAAHARPDPEYL